MSKFDRKITYSAKAAEFDAELEPKPAGLWHCVIRMKTGQVFGQTYSSEAAMKDDLKRRSKYQVEFVRVTVDGGGAGSKLSVDAAKQAMLEANEGRRGLGERQAVNASNAEERFDKESLDMLGEYFFNLFTENFPKIYAKSPYNDSILKQAMKDMDAKETFANYLQVVEMLNHYKMITPAVAQPGFKLQPYRKMADIVKQAQRDLTEAEKQQLEKFKKLTLDQMREKLHEEKPLLGLPKTGRNAAYTEGHGNPVKRSREESWLRSLPLEELKRQQDAEIKARKDARPKNPMERE